MRSHLVDVALDIIKVVYKRLNLKKDKMPGAYSGVRGAGIAAMFEEFKKPKETSVAQIQQIVADLEEINRLHNAAEQVLTGYYKGINIHSNPDQAKGNLKTIELRIVELKAKIIRLIKKL